ncbi:MAG: hypothetical protein CVV64_09565 [Candidatus Wallbacteria bacterium HGW-Wallbacteria-1]|uniref:Metallo-beta-lactamase domain-containing protein n=1 Tax=Candidatus Wallbacteria bacterium HGW-Wallbacteria-1 TaxID=2013854 RepID=A0A2N1PQJ1_9BACT|nr:MAG: hypothetical protein CVV64_09565 [Candidatus Wallbacteria bacterium HGW-Wallbacteria-1]
MLMVAVIPGIVCGFVFLALGLPVWLAGVITGIAVALLYPEIKLTTRLILSLFALFSALRVVMILPGPGTAIKFEGMRVLCRVRIIDLPRNGKYGARALVRITEFQGHSMEMQAYIPGECIGDSCFRGQELLLEGKLKTGYLRFNQFMENYINSPVGLNEVKILNNSLSLPAGIGSAIYRCVETALIRHTSRETASFCGQLVLASQKHRESREIFGRTGLVHLIAISGMHVTIFLSIAATLLRVTGLPVTLIQILMVLLALSVIFMTGMRPSVIRAVIMAVPLVSASLFNARGDPVNSLSLATTCLCLFRPLYLMEPSFILSVSATVILLWPRRIDVIESGAVKGNVHSETSVAGSEVLMGLKICLLMAPYAMVTIGATGFQAIIATPFAAPLIAAILKGTLILTAVDLITPSLAAIPAAFLDFLTDLLMKMARALEMHEYMFFQIRGFDILHAIFFYSAAVLIWYALSTGFFRRVGIVMRFPGVVMAVVFLVCVYFIISQFQPRMACDSLLTLGVADVGQGSSILLKWRGRTLLVDTGPPQGTGSLVRWLEKKSSGPLDGVLITHLHDDHYGGLARVVERIGTSVIYCGPGRSGELNQLLRQSGIQWNPNCQKELNAGQVVEFDSEIKIRVLRAPDPVLSEADQAQDENSRSVVLVVETDGFAILIPGDVSGEAAREVFAQFSDLCRKRDLPAWIVSPHHGSDGSLAEIYSEFQGEIMVICQSGRGNRHGHPGKKFLEIMKREKITLFRTDEIGAFVLNLDPVSGRFFQDKGVICRKM